MEGTCTAKERVEDFKRIGKSEHSGVVERMTSGAILAVARQVFRWGWPGTMAVVGLAFLRVDQDLVGVVDLVFT